MCPSHSPYSLIQRGHGGLSSAVFPDAAVDVLAEGGDVLPADSEAGCQLMAAEALQQVGTGFQCRKQGSALYDKMRLMRDKDREYMLNLIAALTRL